MVKVECITPRDLTGALLLRWGSTLTAAVTAANNGRNGSEGRGGSDGDVLGEEDTAVETDRV